MPPPISTAGRRDQASGCHCWERCWPSARQCLRCSRPAGSIRRRSTSWTMNHSRESRARRLWPAVALAAVIVIALALPVHTDLPGRRRPCCTATTWTPGGSGRLPSAESVPSGRLRSPDTPVQRRPAGVGGRPGGPAAWSCRPSCATSPGTRGVPASGRASPPWSLLLAAAPYFAALARRVRTTHDDHTRTTARRLGRNRPASVGTKGT